MPRMRRLTMTVAIPILLFGGFPPSPPVVESYEETSGDFYVKYGTNVRVFEEAPGIADGSSYSLVDLRTGMGVTLGVTPGMRFKFDPSVGLSGEKFGDFEFINLGTDTYITSGTIGRFRFGFYGNYELPMGNNDSTHIPYRAVSGGLKAGAGFSLADTVQTRRQIRDGYHPLIVNLLVDGYWGKSLVQDPFRHGASEYQSGWYAANQYGIVATFELRWFESADDQDHLSQSCTDDARELCYNHLTDGHALMACLNDHYQKLDNDCRWSLSQDQ